MKKQKGQVIIEFALILPLFIFLLYGIIYCGMLFYDYISLSNIARSAARECAIVQDFSAEQSRIETYYTGKMDSLLTSLYTPYDDPESHVKLKATEATDTIDLKDADGNTTGTETIKGIQVTIVMQRNGSSALMQMMLPDSFVISYYMRRDEQPVTTPVTPPA